MFVTTRAIAPARLYRMVSPGVFPNIDNFIYSIALPVPANAFFLPPFLVDALKLYFW